MLSSRGLKAPDHEVRSGEGLEAFRGAYARDSPLRQSGKEAAETYREIREKSYIRVGQ
jgi:hypothetical protein